MSDRFHDSSLVDGLIAQGMGHLCDAIGAFARARDLAHTTQTREHCDAIVADLVKAYAKTPPRYTGVMISETETLWNRIQNAAVPISRSQDRRGDQQQKGQDKG
jgi:hypothetical protein